MAETIEIKNKAALSGWPMILGWAAMLIFALHACTHMVGAGDTWVAMACGKHFLNHGVDTVEPFSANSHRAGPTEEDIEKWPTAAKWIADKVGIDTVRYWHPTGWVNQNWLTHVIFYWVTHESPIADADTFSFNSLAYWKFALYILMTVCIFYVCRNLGVNPALAAVFSCFAMFVGRSFFDVRPAGFSNLLTAVFVLLLVLTTYRNVLYIWLVVPMAALWCNLHGGYIYIYIMFVPFFFLNLLTVKSKKWFVSIGARGLYHTMGAGAATFLATIIFNPFHLTNLTHTFIISVSEDAKMWRSVNEWHPAFEWNNPVGDEIPFLIMYIISWLVLVVWIVTLIATSRSVERKFKKKLKEPHEYQLPKIDLALMAIAALTIYMAIRSRRFIPIAAVIACPILALFIDQIVCMISATLNLQKNNRFAVPAMPKLVKQTFIVLATLAVVYFGTWWGLKYKRIYLDPWPTDRKLNSVLMRMTASDAKPFYAMQFIRENKLKGKMFNYWTEGGFIAWGQDPDPNTGKTPLQLFMDGRAQAAYEPKAYHVWTEIMQGGPAIISAKIRREKLTASDYKKAGEWISQRLKKRDVWVTLMPAGQFDTPFVRGLERNPDWVIVFYNNKQKLLVDMTTAQGKKLFEGIFSGETIYPDEFTKNLALSHNLYLYGKNKQSKAQAFDYATKAFELNQSQAPMQKVIFASRYPELRGKVYDFCNKYLEEFDKNRDAWSKESGYHHRIVAALVSANFLQNVARQQKNTELIERYTAKNKEYNAERRGLLSRRRW